MRRLVTFSSSLDKARVAEAAAELRIPVDYALELLRESPRGSHSKEEQASAMSRGIADTRRGVRHTELGGKYRRALESARRKPAFRNALMSEKHRVLERLINQRWFDLLPPSKQEELREIQRLRKKGKARKVVSRLMKRFFKGLTFEQRHKPNLVDIIARDKEWVRKLPAHKRTELELLLKMPVGDYNEFSRRRRALHEFWVSLPRPLMHHPINKLVERTHLQG